MVYFGITCTILLLVIFIRNCFCSKSRHFQTEAVMLTISKWHMSWVKNERLKLKVTRSQAAYAIPLEELGSSIGRIHLPHSIHIINLLFISFRSLACYSICLLQISINILSHIIKVKRWCQLKPKGNILEGALWIIHIRFFFLWNRRCFCSFLSFSNLLGSLISFSLPHDAS